MDHTKMNPKDLDSSCQKLFNGGLGIVVALLVCSGIIFVCVHWGSYPAVGLRTFTRARHASWPRSQSLVLLDLGTMLDRYCERRNIFSSAISPPLLQCIWSYGQY